MPPNQGTTDDLIGLAGMDFPLAENDNLSLSDLEDSSLSARLRAAISPHIPSPLPPSTFQPSTRSEYTTALLPLAHILLSYPRLPSPSPSATLFPPTLRAPHFPSPPPELLPTSLLRRDIAVLTASSSITPIIKGTPASEDVLNYARFAVFALPATGVGVAYALARAVADLAAMAVMVGEIRGPGWEFLGAVAAAEERVWRAWEEEVDEWGRWLGEEQEDMVVRAAEGVAERMAGMLAELAVVLSTGVEEEGVRKEVAKEKTGVKEKERSGEGWFGFDYGVPVGMALGLVVGGVGIYGVWHAGVVSGFT
ncbi:hypothetical protein EJ06DRAFT_584187 [Trichodelitschia bisporula]|uniref:Heme oxygenase-like protein n=1 Tax=Trichodelitschia bisporula TaxID=703511 RepID=A0A6G1HP26_9PEZI|nr:hypothetical protein EJ06DRAFT_584187 [Trichodelitschia bisporula]